MKISHAAIVRLLIRVFVGVEAYRVASTGRVFMSFSIDILLVFFFSVGFRRWPSNVQTLSKRMNV